MPYTTSEEKELCLELIHVARMQQGAWGVMMVRGVDDWNDVARIYPEFFATIQVSLFWALIISLYRFLEDRDDVVSLRGLYRRMCAENRIPGADRDALDAVVAEMEPLWRKAATLRHKSIAHFDFQVSQQLIYRSEDFSPLEMSDLIDRGDRFLQRLQAYFPGQPLVLHLDLTVQYTTAALRDLREFNAERQQL